VRHLLGLALLAACATEPPVHPFRLEGFPGAPVEPDLFPLRDGTRWTFADAAGRTLVVSLREEGGRCLLAGQKEGEAEIREHEGFLEILYQGQVVERPLRMGGAAGDRWQAAGATYTVFGYDEVEVPGRRVRALVVAADRPPVRDLYWFAKDMGWVRMRTERNGKALRDARLVGFEPGGGR
jgi:hypothetical protein